MSDGLRARFYPDDAVQRRVEIVENVPMARDTWRVRLAAPDIAARITPGQFVMVRIAGCDDPLIGRPLALYDAAPASGPPQAIDVVYLAKGKFTTRLARCQPGQLLDVWGPLGNGFDVRPASHLIMVAGGIGQTPLLALAREALGVQQYGPHPRRWDGIERVSFCYGARSADLLAGVDDFRRAGIDVRLATDDGSHGHHGLVSDLLTQLLDEHPRDRGERPVHVVCCGPERMMERVSQIAEQRGIGCDVSLETPMACGIGICFTCVARVRDDAGQWDYKRTCVEGPVFEARSIVW